MIIDGNIYFPTEEGHFISETQRRVAEILVDYDSNLELQWIPPGERGPKDYAFRVVDRNPRGSDYVVCFAHECDERLLAKVFQSDNSKKNIQNYLDAHNAAMEAIRLKAEIEEREEAHELAYSILNSNKIHYKHKGIDYGKPFGGRFE